MIGLVIFIIYAVFHKNQVNQESNAIQVNNSAKDFSELLKQRRHLVREQCEKLELQGKLRSSYIVPENFLTLKKYQAYTNSRL